MVALTPLQRRRRAVYPKPDILTHLPAFAFTDAHRKQIAAGELVLRSIHVSVIDITRRDGMYFMRDDRGRESRIPPSTKFSMSYPAVPVPPKPVYNASVIPPESEYTSLTLAMRRALEYFAWASWKPKPRHFTLVNLEKRGLIEAVTYGTSPYRTTAYGNALYREYGRHDKELKNGST